MNKYQVGDLVKWQWNTFGFPLQEYYNIGIIIKKSLRFGVWTIYEVRVNQRYDMPEDRLIKIMQER